MKHHEMLLEAQLHLDCMGFAMLEQEQPDLPAASCFEVHTEINARRRATGLLVQSIRIGVLDARLESARQAANAFNGTAPARLH